MTGGRWTGRAPWLLPGAAAGTAGGLAFALAMLNIGGMLPTIAGVAGSDATGIGLVVHAVASVLIGIFFALLTSRRAAGPGELIFWGMAYGVMWWLLGALTLLPLLSGAPVAWTLAAVQAAYPALLGHLLFGAVAGAVLAGWNGATGRARPTLGAGIRGVIAGGLSGVAVVAALRSAGLSDAAGFGRSGAAQWIMVPVLGAVAGAAFSLLYPRPLGALGPALVRGLNVGFLFWLTGPMTVIPLVTAGTLPWTLEESRARAVALPVTVLAGVLLVGLYRVFGRVAGTTRDEDPAELADEGVGTRVLQGLVRGTAAGLVGGTLFTGVLVAVGGLGRIAELVGGRSAGLGLLVHLLIAVVLGATYGIAFRHEGTHAEAALGWGLSYGVLWWLLGNDTLLPLLLGQPPAWTVAGLAAGLPSLVGHLLYGVGLGLTLAWLERRANPWWTASTPARARRAELLQSRRAATAPGLWTLSTVLVLGVLTLAAGA